MSDVDYKSVPCPTCGARAGSWCKRPSGHSGPFVDFHAARRKAAEEAEAAGGVRLGTPAMAGTVRWALGAARRAGNMWSRDTLTLNIVRMDDFYNAFDQDAVEIAELLEVVLSRIQYDVRDVPMAGVPVTDAPDYFARLVAGGYRLIVVEQDDTAVVWTATEPKPVQLSLF